MAAKDAARVCFQIGFVIDLKPDAALTQFGDGLFHVLYRKIQDSECSRLMIRLGVKESFRTAGKRNNQCAFRAAGKFKSEGLAVKFPGFLNIVDRKATEGPVRFEHRPLLWFQFSIFDAI